MRKAAHEGLNKGVVKAFHKTQIKEALILASDGLNNPAEWDKHVRRATASMVLTVVYDQPTIKPGKDHTTELVNDYVRRLGRAAYPGAHLVEFFPWMRYIPSRFAFSIFDPFIRHLTRSRFAAWKRNAEAWYKKDSAMFEDLFNSVRDKCVRMHLNSRLFRALICF